MAKFIVLERMNPDDAWKEISLPLEAYVANETIANLRMDADYQGITEAEYTLQEVPDDEPEAKDLHTFFVCLVGLEDCFPKMEKYIQAESRSAAIAKGNAIAHYRVYACYCVD